ncbi:hypothetical protein [Motilibacter deserti]|uniref:DUF1906 domain-containing protein n=1 Tax=Motilibacter deserti TaxID=2714956 RepID=A0ABX0GTZ4_9ACTN|nr:hypothetical protein [Motilibacter deserti]NHC13124.1 hypothetical protein [Motilibacter deserti]
MPRSTLRSYALRAGLAAALVAPLAASPGTASAAGLRPVAVPGTVGVDVSKEQTGDALPDASRARFGVVNVNGGNFGLVNGDFARQWSWAKSLPGAPQLYLTPANPGPGGVYWGKGGPKACNGGNTVGCAYDYGWVGARQAVAWARAGGLASGQKAQWWIDIEDDATWNDARPDLNAAVLRGVRDALRASGTASSVGVYVLAAHWRSLVAPTAARQKQAADLAALPVWAVAGGAATSGQARRRCSEPSSTGGTGPVVLAQSFAEPGEISVDIVCPVKPVGSVRVTRAGVAALRGTALPGTKVSLTVSQRGRAARTVRATAGATGSWAVNVRSLAPKAGGTVRVSGSSRTVTLLPAR